MIYNYTQTAIVDEAVIVEKEYTGGIDMNYVKPSFKPLKILYLKISGKKVDSSFYKLIFEKTTIQKYVVVFPVNPTISGSVTICYLYEGMPENSQPYEETVEIIRYNRTITWEEGTKDFYITVKNYPIVAPSTSYPIKIKDKNNIEILYTNSSLVQVSGNGREQIKVHGIYPEGPVKVSYYYAKGELGNIWKENLQYNEDIMELDAFLLGTDGKYQVNLDKALADKSAAGKVYRLWLKRLILNLLPDYAEENVAVDDVRTYWNSIKGSAINWTDYQTLFNKINTAKTTIEGNTTPASLQVQHNQNCPKIYTYLAQLADIDNQAYNVTFSATSQRYDYDGNSNEVLIPQPSLDQLTDGLLTIAHSYYESANYALRLDFPAGKYITGLTFEPLPYDLATVNLDNILIHIGGNDSYPTLHPNDFTNGGWSDKQVNNFSFKDAFKQDTHFYPITNVVNETLKDGDGSPVSKDSVNSAFDHRIMMPRRSVFVFKKSNMSVNYLTEVDLLMPSDDIIVIMTEITNVISTGDRERIYSRTLSLLDQYSDGHRYDRVIAAWRADDTDEWGVGYGVDSSGNIAFRDPGGFPQTFFDARDIGVLGVEPAWSSGVRPTIDGIIDSNYDYLGSMATVIAVWSAELTTEGISTDSKIIQTNYEIWKRKFEEALASYTSAINSKNKKHVEKKEKQQLLTAYQPNLVTPV